MKKRRGCLIAVLAALLLIFCVVCFFVGGGVVDYRLETYESWHAGLTERMKGYEGWINPMPSLDTLSDAKEIRFQKYKGNFWGEEAYVLIAQYDEKQYEHAKRILHDTMVFETEDIDQGERYPQIKPAFTMGRFSVRLLKTGDLPYGVEVPKDMCFAGTTDSACEILYVYHDDVDLDSISESFEKSIPELIHWSSIEWMNWIPFLNHVWLPVM